MEWAGRRVGVLVDISALYKFNWSLKAIFTQIKRKQAPYGFAWNEIQSKLYLILEDIAAAHADGVPVSPILINLCAPTVFTSRHGGGTDRTSHQLIVGVASPGLVRVD